MRSRIIIIVVVLLLLCSTSCNVFKRAYEIDQTCPAPCWNGLTIGMPFDEAVTILDEMKEYDYSVGKESDGSFRVLLTGSQGEITYIDFSDNSVKYIHLLFDSTMKLPLSEVIKNYGEPEEMVIWIALMPMNRKEAVLCYPEIGAVVRLAGQRIIDGNLLFEVGELTNVDFVTYDKPGLETSDSYLNYCAQPLEYSVRQFWNGYGLYNSCEPNVSPYCEEYSGK